MWHIDDAGHGPHRGLHYHNGMAFSTYDMDQDNQVGNCALTFTGGWWFNSCHSMHPNGMQTTSNSSQNDRQMQITNEAGQRTDISYSEMTMIRIG